MKGIAIKGKIVFQNWVCCWFYIQKRMGRNYRREQALWRLSCRNKRTV